jgi:hypothetical protein
MRRNNTPVRDATLSIQAYPGSVTLRKNEANDLFEVLNAAGLDLAQCNFNNDYFARITHQPSTSFFEVYDGLPRRYTARWKAGDGRVMKRGISSWPEVISVALEWAGEVKTPDRWANSVAAPHVAATNAASSVSLPKMSSSFAGHVFISYAREDSRDVDRLQRALIASGVPVWRDTADLWPGQDWRIRIRDAITTNALVFIACFSSRSVARKKSYQNEELILAIEQLRLYRPDVPWLIPVRFDDCEIPDLNLGAGRTLTSVHRADLFDERRDEGIARLITIILRVLGNPGS